jgi:hypothetical protein
MEINAQEMNFDDGQGMEKLNDNHQILRRSIKDQYKASVSPYVPPL